MTTARKRLAVLLGGRSGEHEVSVMSARSIVDAVDRDRYDVVLIGITRDGQWRLLPDEHRVFDEGKVTDHGVPVAPLPGRGGFVRPDRPGELMRIDIAFPVLHGTYGEDGTVQGLLELTDIAYVGAGVTASALGMDKLVMKTMFRAADIPIAEFVGVSRSHVERDPDGAVRLVEHDIGYPCFSKPANLGSSVGICRNESRVDLVTGLRVACRYDARIIVERAVPGRELECSVLGNEEPIASVVGEIVPTRSFYDYQSKYVDSGSKLIVPAELPPETADRVRELAVAASRVIDCAGMARVDFFLTPDGEVIVNEINTIPGFTRISMYPRLWEASGLSWQELIDRLLELGWQRYADRQRNETVCG